MKNSELKGLAVGDIIDKAKELRAEINLKESSIERIESGEVDNAPLLPYLKFHLALLEVQLKYVENLEL